MLAVFSYFLLSCWVCACHVFFWLNGIGPSCCACHLWIICATGDSGLATLSFVHPFLCLYLSSSACTHIHSLIALSYHHSKSYSCNCNPIALSGNTAPEIVHKIDRDLNLFCEPLPAPNAPPLIKICNNNCLTCRPSIPNHVLGTL